LVLKKGSLKLKPKDDHRGTWYKKGKYPAELVTGSNHKKTQAHEQRNQD